MATQQDWAKSKLTEYLQYDYWHPFNAWHILAGFDYHAGFEYEFDPHIAFENHDDKLGLDGCKPTQEMIDDLVSLLNFWDATYKGYDSQLIEEQPPSYFIEWALSKNYRPAWLDWAIERGLYIPTQVKELLVKELLDVRRVRLQKWVAEEKAKGTKAFNKIVAKKEGISVTRLKQIIGKKKQSEKSAANSWQQGLPTPTRQTISKKQKNKY